MRKVYLLQTGELNEETQMFTFYKKEVFGSLKRAKAALQNQIDVNKGTQVDDWSELMNYESVVDYTTIGYTGNDDNPTVEKRVRVMIEPMELK